jgi:DNA-binding MarR family transcriptional regulator
MAFHFKGFESPAFTQMPNAIVDELLPELNEGELKILLYIVRRTFGFHRDHDDISIKQLTDGITTKDGRQLDRGTGMSRSAVVRALKGLQDKGVIVSQRNVSQERGNEPNTYSLKFSP